MNDVAEAAAASADRLKLTEIFLSLQGEARDAGWPTVFVRLTGCPLRCQYCDTAYAFHDHLLSCRAVRGWERKGRLF